MIPATLAPPAEPTMLALAIAKTDSAAQPITARVARLANSRQRIVLSSAEWHLVLNELAGARMALRTQQILTRRGAA